jgi:hypothetical protein
MSKTTVSGQRSVSFDVIRSLRKKNGPVDFPTDFTHHKMSSTLRSLRRGNWPEQDIQNFKTEALSGDEAHKINSCLLVFRAGSTN